MATSAVPQITWYRLIFTRIFKKNYQIILLFLVLTFVFLYLSKRACEVTIRLNVHTMNDF